MLVNLCRIDTLSELPEVYRRVFATHEIPMRRVASIVFLSLSAAFVAGAFAADAPKPTMVRGTIQSLDTKSMTIKTDAGTLVTAPVTLMTRFAAVEKRSFSQIKPTDFVGVTTVPGANGHLKAEEVHIIPLAGIGEGQYPWDHHPSTGMSSTTSMGSMTNGTVTTAKVAPLTGGSMTNGTVTNGAGAWQLSLTYHGAAMIDGKCEGVADHTKPPVCTGTALIDVSPDTPITAIIPYRHDLVKPGVAVVAAIITDPSGHPQVSSATVEKNGVKPEF